MRSSSKPLYRRPGSPFWWARLTVQGREQRESTKCQTYTEAKTWLTTRLADIAEGRYVAPAIEKRTVADLLATLEARYEAEGRPSLRTLRTHKTAWLDILGDRRARDVDETTLLRIVTRWKAAGYTPATIDKRLGMLRRAYYIDRHARRIAPSFPHLVIHNTREHFCAWPTVLALVAELRDRDPALADFTEWGARTGMRKGEISKLEWAGYDAETSVLRLPGRSAKTGKPRRIVLVGPLREIIERRVAARVPDAPWIFHHRNGRRIGDFRKQWAKACKAIELVPGIAGLTFHDLRRVAVRNLRRAGVQETVAMAISGHLTTSTFQRYNITDDHDLAEAMEKVTAYTDQRPAKIVHLKTA